ncbi:IS21 family transposase [bacterium]|nr:IS21 family transposase [bacterium]
MYKKIQNFKKNGLTRAEIVRQTGRDAKTVRKYYDMSPEEYAAYVTETSNREKNFNSFKDEILKVYEANGDRVLIKSAVYDYLEELFGDLPGTERTLCNFIEHLIETEQLVLTKNHRTYTPVEQLPFGQQLQVDFGEVRTLCKKKVHIFAAVLSASRFKYCAVQDHPFKTEEVIQHLLDCFLFIGGMPKELVIDQDRTMVTKENYGDIIYTAKFQDFINEMGLNMYVCRKSDPESKGKVENMIKFVKQNFFSVRQFENFEEISERLHNWLIRRANGKISIATRRIPAEMIKHERNHLRPVKNSIHQKDNFIAREDRKVDESGFILVNTTKYELPELYQNREVEIYTTDFKLLVYNKNNGDLVIEHNISPIPGKTVYAKKVCKKWRRRKEELSNELKSWISNDCWSEFIDICFNKYKRYFRDQHSCAKKYLKENINHPEFIEALEYCVANDIYSMSCLKDTYNYYKNRKIPDYTISDKHKIKPLLKRKNASYYLKVDKRNIASYNQFLKEAAS